MSDRSASGSASLSASEDNCLRLGLREEKYFSSGKFNGTKPVSCEVIGNQLDVGKKWGDLYANLIEFLLEHGFLSDDYSYFQDTEPTQRSYRASNGLWVVINLSCDDSVRRIRSLVEESGISFNDIQITYRKGWADPDLTVGDVPTQGRITQVRLNQVPSKRFSGTKPISLQIAGVTLAGASWRAILVRLIEFLVRKRLIRTNHKYLQPKKGLDNQFLRINGRILNVCVHGSADEIVKRRIYTLVKDAKVRPSSVVISYLTPQRERERETKTYRPSVLFLPTASNTPVLLIPFPPSAIPV